MRLHLKRLILAVAVGATMFGGSDACAAELSPVGLWRTFSVTTGREAGAVEIRQVGDTLVGKIVKSIPQPGDPVDPVCGGCDGPDKNQPVLGLTILRGLHRDGDIWDGGTVLDPRTGTVYSAEIRLDDGGRLLKLRGYLGFSLFGQTVTWIRAE
jgi:uncharacterized protein (DUF2147 family)